MYLTTGPSCRHGVKPPTLTLTGHCVMNNKAYCIYFSTRVMVTHNVCIVLLDVDYDKA